MIVSSAPENVYLMLTNACNLRCKYCFAESTKALPNELDRDEWIAVLHQFVDAKIFNVTVSGGELFVKDGIFEILAELDKLPLRYSIDTNATLINREVALFLSTLRRSPSVSVSLDGSSPEVHDKLRGRGAFNQTITGVQHLLNADMRVSLFTVLTPINAHDVENIVEFSLRLGVMRVTLNPCIPRGRAEFTSNVILSAKESRSVGQRIYAMYEKYGDFVASTYIGLAALFCKIMLIGLGLVVPWILKVIIDTALPSKDVGLLGKMIALIIIVPITHEVLKVGDEQFRQAAAGRAAIDVRQELFHHLHKMSLHFFTKTSTGEILSLFQNDILRLEMFFHSLQTITTQLFKLLLTGGILIYLDWRLTCIAFLFIPPFSLAYYLTRKRSRQLGEQRSEHEAEVSKTMHEQFSNVETIRVHVQETAELNLLTEKISGLMRINVWAAIMQDMGNSVLAIFAGLGIVAVFWYGGYLVAAGALTLGSLVAFYAYISNLYEPISKLTQVYMGYSEKYASLAKIFQWLDKPIDLPEPHKPFPLTTCRGVVEFKSVSFSYQPGQPVLQDITFRIEPGQTVALVGRSGSGKTTLAYLLARFCDPSSGTITLDGRDLRSFSREQLMQHIGIVMQDVIIFHQSIRDNLRLAKQDATDKELEEACRTANIHERIMAFPNGYDTIVGERGQCLSGGEKQRISIARVFLRQPTVFILDEITAAQDAITEAAIKEALDSVMTGHTKLVIAHRMSTIQSADKILVLHNNRIVASGTHDELTNETAIYRELYQDQLALKEIW